jgi:hypothetical protein
LLKLELELKEMEREEKNLFTEESDISTALYCKRFVTSLSKKVDKYQEFWGVSKPLFWAITFFVVFMSFMATQQYSVIRHTVRGVRLNVPSVSANATNTLPIRCPSNLHQVPGK